MMVEKEDAIQHAQDQVLDIYALEVLTRQLLFVSLIAEMGYHMEMKHVMMA